MDGQLATAAARKSIGIVPNRPHQAAGGVIDMGSYRLGIVEFDDQGRCHDRRQMEAVAGWLDGLGDRDAIILVFVHGWKHDARSDDGNLADVRRVIESTVAYEALEQGKSGGQPRPVFGLFVGWRGMSLYDRWGLLENLTFWDRQEAARRVAVGSVRELLGRFRHYRNRLKDAGGSPLLVVVGHSFGGMIVFSALAQSLIEAATAPRDEVTPRFADLVLLVNPAIEGARYLPIFDLVRTRATRGQTVDQPPVFVCATASNDWATGIAFPVGNAASWLTESYRGIEERQAMMNTVGHLPWMKTHDLRAGSGSGDYRLEEVPSATGSSPFWVVQAEKAVIDGHNDIFRPPFLRFVADRVFVHVKKGI